MRVKRRIDVSERRRIGDTIAEAAWVKPEEIWRGPAGLIALSRNGAPSGPTLRLDADVIEWFKIHARGERGYQSSINSALREYVARHGRE